MQHACKTSRSAIGPRRWDRTLTGEGLTAINRYGTMGFMTRIKKGKNIRVPEQAIPMMADLRDVMKRTTHIGGLMINPAANLTDGTVVGFALAMTLMLMRPEMALVDRTKLAALVDRELVARLDDIAKRTPDERLALVDLIIAGAAEFSGYSADGPLRATPPEGRGEPHY